LNGDKNESDGRRATTSLLFDNSQVEGTIIADNGESLVDLVFRYRYKRGILIGGPTILKPAFNRQAQMLCYPESKAQR
jgi:hypothetical protein